MCVHIEYWHWWACLLPLKRNLTKSHPPVHDNSSYSSNKALWGHGLCIISQFMSHRVAISLLSALDSVQVWQLGESKVQALAKVFKYDTCRIVTVTTPSSTDLTRIRGYRSFLWDFYARRSHNCRFMCEGCQGQLLDTSRGKCQRGVDERLPSGDPPDGGHLSIKSNHFLQNSGKKNRTTKSTIYHILDGTCSCKIKYQRKRRKRLYFA